MQLTLTIDEAVLHKLAQSTINSALRDGRHDRLGEAIRDMLDEAIRETLLAVDWQKEVSAVVDQMKAGIVERCVGDELTRLVKAEIARQKKAGTLVQPKELLFDQQPDGTMTEDQS